MVTFEQMRDTIFARRPVVPYWVRLRSGERFEITAPFRTALSKTTLHVSIDGIRMRQIPYTEVAAFGPLTETDGNGQRATRGAA